HALADRSDRSATTAAARAARREVLAAAGAAAHHAPEMSKHRKAGTDAKHKGGKRKGASSGPPSTSPAAAQPASAPTPAPAPAAACPGEGMHAISAHLDRGWDHLQKSDFRRAIVSAEEVLKLDERSPEAYTLLGAIAAAQGHAEEALEHYGRAMEL